MKQEFKVGDLVRLKSGGPAMTIRDIAKDGDVICWWHGIPRLRADDSEVSSLLTEGFHPAMLEAADPIGERHGETS